MRQLIIQVPRERGDEATELAREHEGVNLSRVDATREGDSIALLLLNLSNARVDPLLRDLRDLPDLRVTIFTSNVLALHPPRDEVSDQVTDVSMRSPLEVVLNGLQSIGSWPGFLGYAAAGAALVWIGLFTNSSFLLVAAMLVAPFAGPALNVALGSARGDPRLARQGVVRYLAGIGLTVAVTALLTWLLGASVVTEQMTATGTISATAVLLPLVAGAAGALTLMQPESSDLVSGAAAGMLVAAALAPPAGLVGMTLAQGEWDLAWRGGFVLLLQLVGIHLAGAAVFRVLGISAAEGYHGFGRRWMFPLLGSVSLALVALLLWAQLRPPPALERGSLSRRAVAEVQSLFDPADELRVLRIDAEFTDARAAERPVLLVALDAAPRERAAPLAPERRAELERRTADRVREGLLAWDPEIAPFVRVALLEPPPP